MKTRDDDYLRVKQAAMMGIAPNTMRKWGATGKIPVYRNPISG
jgi:predicted site-specific integrase-resolvase